MADTTSKLDAMATYEEASEIVLRDGATEEDVKHALELVDGLGDEYLSSLIRRTAAAWRNANLAEYSQPRDPADAVAYDYEDEDGEED